MQPIFTPQVIRPISNPPDHFALKRANLKLLGYFEKQKKMPATKVSGRVCLLPSGFRFLSTFKFVSLSLDDKVNRSFPSAYESVFSPFGTPCVPSSKPFPSPYTPSGGYSHDNPQPRSLPLTRPLKGGYGNVSIHPSLVVPFHLNDTS